MINPRELRIGNLVKHDFGIASINMIRGNDIGLYDANLCLWVTITELISPIPLNEDWLLKFGFEKKELYGWKGNGADYQPETSKTEYQDYVIEAYDEDYFFVRYATWSYRKEENHEWVSETDVLIHKGTWYEKAEDHVRCQKVNYIHQLQNIYFALTGKELEIKQ